MNTYRKEKIWGRQAELGWTVARLAEKARVSVPTVIAIRAGKSVTTTKLEQVVQALGLTMAEIYEPAEEAAA
jgi:transcriptional regulator with XRE-family HTH domain